VNPPLKIEVITPANTSTCARWLCFKVLMKWRRALPWDDCLKNSSHDDDGFAAGISSFGADAFKMRFLMGGYNLENPFEEDLSFCASMVAALWDSKTFVILFKSKSSTPWLVGIFDAWFAWCSCWKDLIHFAWRKVDQAWISSLSPDGIMFILFSRFFSAAQRKVYNCLHECFFNFI